MEVLSTPLGCSWAGWWGAACGLLVCVLPGGAFVNAADAGAVYSFLRAGVEVGLVHNGLLIGLRTAAAAGLVSALLVLPAVNAR